MCKRNKAKPVNIVYFEVISELLPVPTPGTFFAAGTLLGLLLDGLLCAHECDSAQSCLCSAP